MGLLSYIEPVGAALSLAKNLLRPDRSPAAASQAPSFDFRAELERRMTSAEASADKVLEQFDANGDGYLSRSELAMSRETFAQMDLNGDARLDIAELTLAQLRQQE